MLPAPDPNIFTLHLSKFATIHIQHEGNLVYACLRKISYKKMGQKTILVKTEIDLTLQELEILGEAIPVLCNFLSLAYTANQIPVPIVPAPVSSREATQ